MLLSPTDQAAHLQSVVLRTMQTADIERRLAEARRDSGTPYAMLKELRFMSWLTREAGMENVKPLVGRPGYWAGLRRLMLHWSIQGGRIGDMTSVDIRYCYDAGRDAAEKALEAWDGTGEPKGWQRHPASGRRRVMANEDLEYVEF